MFERMDLGSVDAVAVFDADVIVGREFFRAMDRELARGARCLQAFNGISNPDASTVTRMLAVTYVMKNLLFFAGKNALGLSVLLSGTGMVFASDVVRRHGWRAMSIGEDLEQTFSLLEAGERIGFVADAAGFAQESTSLSQAYTQRQRWLTGRFALYGRAGRAILAGLRRRSLQELECGLELLSPTYATHMNLTLIALVAAVPLAPAWPSFLALAALALGYQVLEIGVALVIMRARPSFVLSLAFAPAFLALRAVVDVLAVFGRRRGHWARTQRAPRGEEDLAE